MKYSVSYSEEAVVKTAFSVELDPSDYLEYDNEEEVFTAIDVENGNVDYDECSEVEITKCDFDIPEEFWNTWRTLKAQKNDN